MPELRFMTMAGGVLRPDTEDTAETVQKWGVGKFVVGTFKRPRNPKFHRKYFALLDVLFEQWDPVPFEKYRDIEPQKNREKFREEITILAGYYDVVCSLKGETRVVAKSISFAAMDEDTFGELYNSVHKVGMDKILSQKNWKDSDLNDAVDRLMGFV